MFLGSIPRTVILNHVGLDDMRHVDKLASGKSDASSARKQKFNPLTWHGWPRGSQEVGDRHGGPGSRDQGHLEYDIR
jgi:hypothetical protein